MASARVQQALSLSPTALAWLVEQGLLRAVARVHPYPSWDSVRFDPVAVTGLALDAPGELARARANAPVFRTSEVARASALGVVLRVNRIA
jgi:hypothetical protein